MDPDYAAKLGVKIKDLLIHKLLFSLPQNDETAFFFTILTQETKFDDKADDIPANQSPKRPGTPHPRSNRTMGPSGKFSAYEYLD